MVTAAAGASVQLQLLCKCLGSTSGELVTAHTRDIEGRTLTAPSLNVFNGKCRTFVIEGDAIYKSPVKSEYNKDIFYLLLRLFTDQFYCNFLVGTSDTQQNQGTNGPISKPNIDRVTEN